MVGVPYTGVKVRVADPSASGADDKVTVVLIVSTLANVIPVPSVPVPAVWVTDIPATSPATLETLNVAERLFKVPVTPVTSGGKVSWFPTWFPDPLPLKVKSLIIPGSVVISNENPDPLFPVELLLKDKVSVFI